MQPEQSNTHQNFSIDYLNEIAGPQPSKGPNAKLMIVVAIVGVLAIALFAFMMLTRNTNTPTSQLIAINLRLQTLQTVSKAQHKKIRDNNLQRINSDLTLYLTNASRDINTSLTATNTDPKKADKKVLADEDTYATSLSDKFSEATLNVELDETYSRQMAYELGVLKAMMAKLKSSSRSQSINEFISSNTASLELIAKDFETFTDTK